MCVCMCLCDDDDVDDDDDDDDYVDDNDDDDDNNNNDMCSHVFDCRPYCNISSHLLLPHAPAYAPTPCRCPTPVRRLEQIVRAMDPFVLACLQAATMECKSVVLGLALVCRYCAALCCTRKETVDELILIQLFR